VAETEKDPVPASEPPERHLEALAGFARLNAPPESAQRLVELSKLALPHIDRFLSGDRSDEVFTELRALLPSVQESFKALSDVIAPASSTALFSQGPGWGIRAMIHAGAHIQAAVWGLFPDSPESLAEAPSRGESWTDLLDWNLEQAKIILSQATELAAVWERITTEAARTIKESS